MPNILRNKIENREITKMQKENNFKKLEAQTQRNKNIYKQNANNRSSGKFDL